jgi:hypothetical protein
MTTSRTRRKLDEARFFLEKLESSIAHHPDFDYFLSAFVSSARSVTWVMKAEYKRCPGWLDWYDNKTPEAAEERLLKQMNTLRVHSEKIEPLRARPAVVLHIPADQESPELRELLANGVGRRFKAWMYEATENGEFQIPDDVPKNATFFSGSLEGFERHMPGLLDDDVLSACVQYVAALEQLVAESERVANAG